MKKELLLNLLDIADKLASISAFILAYIMYRESKRKQKKRPRKKRKRK